MNPFRLRRPLSLNQIGLSLSVVMAAITACSGESTNIKPTAATDGGGAVAVAASGCKPDIATIQQTVFLPRCASSGCHAAGGADPAGALDLQTAGVDARLINVAASECGGQTIVKPGDPDHSYLLNKLGSTTPTCGTAMPNGSPLAADDVACIRSWVAALPPNTTAGDGGGPGPGPGPACDPGLACGSVCVDAKTDPKNCGACGKVCPIACSNGTCVTTCPGTTTNCSGACVDVTSSAANCGGCGKPCPTGKICSASTCTCGATVSFASQLQPILTSSCASMGCHIGVQPKGGLLLTSGKSYAELVNAPSSACSGKIRVKPGLVDQSYLMNKLTGVGMCAGTQMPKTGASLPAAQLDLFRAWICNNAPNN